MCQRFGCREYIITGKAVFSRLSISFIRYYGKLLKRNCISYDVLWGGEACVCLRICCDAKWCNRDIEIFRQLQSMHMRMRNK